jgi:CRP/FNR family cyclic AMP-dependent transcriptional regulator
VRSIDELVGAHPFAAGLNAEHLALVAGCAHNVSLDAGAMLCMEGASADTFYLLRRGQVSIEVHQAGRGPIVIETVGPGDAVGWSWLVAPYRWTFDARALQPVGALAIDGACLRAKSLEDSALGFALLSRVTQELLERLQATRVRLLDLYGGARG